MALCSCLLSGLLFINMTVAIPAKPHITTQQDLTTPPPGDPANDGSDDQNTPAPALEPDLVPDEKADTPPSLQTETIQTVTFAYQANPRYRQCIHTIQTTPDLGIEQARQWVTIGGGPMARHCLAVAELATGSAKLAAIRLQDLGATENAGDSTTRAQILAQAGEVWLGIDEPDAALSAVTEAFTLIPDDGTLFLLQAKIHQALGKWQPTVDAVTSAQERGFTSAEGFILRARALKELTQFDDAGADLANGLRLDPFNLDGLVLRGELAQVGVIINTNYRRAPKTQEHQENTEPQ